MFLRWNIAFHLKETAQDRTDIRPFSYEYKIPERWRREVKAGAMEVYDTGQLECHQLLSDKA